MRWTPRSYTRYARKVRDKLDEEHADGLDHGDDEREERMANKIQHF